MESQVRDVVEACGLAEADKYQAVYADDLLAADSGTINNKIKTVFEIE